MMRPVLDPDPRRGDLAAHGAGQGAATSAAARAADADRRRHRRGRRHRAGAAGPVRSSRAARRRGTRRAGRRRHGRLVQRPVPAARHARAFHGAPGARLARAGAELPGALSPAVSRPRHDGAGEEHRGRAQAAFRNRRSPRPAAGTSAGRRAARARHLETSLARHTRRRAGRRHVARGKFLIVMAIIGILAALTIRALAMRTLIANPIATNTISSLASSMRSMRREESGGSQRTVRERAARIVASMPGPKPPNQTGQTDRDRRANMGGPRLQAVRRQPPRRMDQVGVADEILEPARRSRSGAGSRHGPSPIAGQTRSAPAAWPLRRRKKSDAFAPAQRPGSCQRMVTPPGVQITEPAGESCETEARHAACPYDWSGGAGVMATSRRWVGRTTVLIAALILLPVSAIALVLCLDSYAAWLHLRLAADEHIPPQLEWLRSALTGIQRRGLS